MELDPNLQKAIINFQAKKYKKSLTLAKKVKAVSPSNKYKVLELSGCCELNLKNHKRAIFLLNQALELAPSVSDKVSTMRNIASSYLAQNEHNPAVNVLEKIIELSPELKSQEIGMELAKVYFLTEKFKKSINAAKALLNKTQFAQEALILICHNLRKLNDKQGLADYFPYVKAELESLTPQQIGDILTIYRDIKPAYLVAVELLSNEHGSVKWFKSLVNKLESTPQNSKANKVKPSVNRIQGDDKEVTLLVEQLFNYLEAKGAEFDSSLSVKVKNGDLSIISDTTTHKNLMSIPIKCMPLLSDYTISSKDRQLVVKPNKSIISPESVPVMELMTKIYNKTGKLDSWERSYSLFQLDSTPAYLDKLLELFGPQKSSFILHQINRNKSTHEQVLVESFYGSRQFNYGKEALKAAGIQTENENEKGLLAIIDFLNHNMDAEGYHLNKDSNSIDISGIPDKETLEVFVQYNLNDPSTTFLNYGFVDMNPTVIFSKPLIVKTKSGLHLKIDRQILKCKPDKLPTDLSPLADFFPGKVSRDGDLYEFSSFTIPVGNDFNVMFKVIKGALSYLNIDGYNSSDALEQDTYEVAESILYQNLKYWNEFEKLLKATTKIESEMLSSQLLELTNICKSSLQKTITLALGLRNF